MDRETALQNQTQVQLRLGEILKELGYAITTQQVFGFTKERFVDFYLAALPLAFLVVEDSQEYTSLRYNLEKKGVTVYEVTEEGVFQYSEELKQCIQDFVSTFPNPRTKDFYTPIRDQPKGSVRPLDGWKPTIEPSKHKKEYWTMVNWISRLTGETRVEVEERLIEKEYNSLRETWRNDRRKNDTQS